MIDGVKVKKLMKHSDDRGFFAELVRDDENLLEHFGQASWSKSYPGVIKAFHYHEKQDDLWFFQPATLRLSYTIFERIQRQKEKRTSIIWAKTIRCCY